MIGKLAGFVLGPAASKWAMVAVVGVLVASSGYAGYRLADNAWLAKQARAYEAWSDDLAKKDKKNREKERKLLEELEDARTKTRVIVKKIPHYVTDDGCVVDDAGVRVIRARVEALFGETE